MGQLLASAHSGQTESVRHEQIAEYDLRVVWFVGFDHSYGLDTFEHMKMLGVEPVTLQSISELRMSTSRSLDRMIVAVINVDGLGEISQWFDVVLQLRAEIPDLVTVISSTNFQHEDLTCERLPICDASIRNPFSETRLTAAISAAIVNNSEWQRRVLTAKRVRLAALMEKQRSMELRLADEAISQHINLSTVVGTEQST